MSSSKPVVSRATLEGAIDELIDVLIEEEVCDIVNERGYDLFFGKEEEELDNEEEIGPELESVDAVNVDIFGQLIGKKMTFEIQCPNCKRTLAAVRFAPHLEKCMGMGRNSSRIASKRLAASAGNSASASFASSADVPRASPSPNNNGSTVASSTVIQTGNADIPSEDDHFEEDVDDDEDWTMEKKRRGKRAIEKPNTKSRKGLSGTGRGRKIDSKTKRSGSPSISVYSPASLIDPTDEASNFSTASSL